MSDLQCPATVVFVPDAARAASLPGSRSRVADVREFPPSEDTAGQLDPFVSDLADQFRGECVVVVAPVDVLRTVLEGRGITVPASASLPDSDAAGPRGADGGPAAAYVAVAVDSDGWTLLP